MRVLLIEDDKRKIEKLFAFFEGSVLTLKESFQGGVLELKENYDQYDYLILDMTIPLWEKGGNDLSGNYEQFGGEKVLREMKRRKLLLPTILFTMFDVFPTKRGNITFNELNDMFKKEFSDFYLGAVFYTSNQDNWKMELAKLIQ
ncbi:hypothetical protein D3C87_1568590 [compost metagenome]